MSALDLVELGARWAHVASAALWVGLGWTLAWVVPPREPSPRAAAWMRGAALATLATGATLLFLVYYGPRTAYLLGAAPEAGPWVTALLVLGAGTIAAELVQRVPPRFGPAPALALGLLALAVAHVCSARLGFTDRATYVHAGAFLALVMGMNVDRAIAPALSSDPRAAARRLRWNAALAFPVLLLMIGTAQAGLFGFGVLPTIAAALLIGWAAAATLGRAAAGPDG